MVGREELLGKYAEVYELQNAGGWLVKKDGRWIVLDGQGVKIHGRDEKIVVHKKKAARQAEELVSDNSETS